jgi:hypothetical protein
MTPRLTSAIVATVGALSLAGVATAHDDHAGAKPAKVYRATLTGAASVKGKAQLVDGKKNNKISIHVRGLTPAATYTWHIHKAASDSVNPCAPATPVVVAPYGDWQYGALVANEDGNASAKGTSKTFDSPADKGPLYVDVHQADGAVVACGVLKSKPKKSHGKHSHSTKQPEAREHKQGSGPKPGHGHDD